MGENHQFAEVTDEYSARLRQIKAELVDGSEASVDGIPEYLLRSWRRSFTHGVKPDDRLLTAARCRQSVIDDQDRYFSAVVSKEIDAVWDSFGGEQWVVYFTNYKGIIVRARHGADPTSYSFALQVGRHLQERDIGTTAPACAFFERRALTLVGAEHYLDEFAHMFCCAVPVWGPWGSVVGVLNITGNEAFKSPLVEQKLAGAASRVEHRLFLDAHRSNRVLRIHYDREFIDTPLAGLVSINAHGDILSVTRHSAQMLDNLDPFRGVFNVADLFVGQLLMDGRCLESTHKNGIVFYIKAQMDASGSDASSAPVVRQINSLRDLGEHHMLETLRQANGNVSKAARLLGVSRTTLYKALSKQAARGPGANRTLGDR